MRKYTLEDGSEAAISSPTAPTTSTHVAPSGREYVVSERTPVDVDDDFWGEFAGSTAGSIGGAALGAGIGSVFPIVGTGLGAIAGGIVGSGVLGGLGNAAEDAYDYYINNKGEAPSWHNAFDAAGRSALIGGVAGVGGKAVGVGVKATARALGLSSPLSSLGAGVLTAVSDTVRNKLVNKVVGSKFLSNRIARLVQSPAYQSMTKEKQIEFLEKYIGTGSKTSEAIAKDIDKAFKAATVSRNKAMEVLSKTGGVDALIKGGPKANKVAEAFEKAGAKSEAASEAVGQSVNRAAEAKLTGIARDTISGGAFTGTTTAGGAAIPNVLEKADRPHGSSAGKGDSVSPRRNEEPYASNWDRLFGDTHNPDGSIKKADRSILHALPAFNDGGGVEDKRKAKLRRLWDEGIKDPKQAFAIMKSYEKRGEL